MHRIRVTTGRSRRPFLVAAVALSLLAPVAGCGGRANRSGVGSLGAPGSASAGTVPFAVPSGGVPTGAVPTGPTTATPATTPPATPPPTTPGPAPTTAPATHAYPGDYALAILSAWGTGDTAYLTLLTSASTASHLQHQLGGPDQHWTGIDTQGAMGSTYETFYNQDGDEITFRINNESLSRHKWHAGAVDTWDPMDYPSDDRAYVTEFTDAWIAGNKIRMELLSSQGMTAHFLGLTAPHPSYVVAEVDGSGTAGHIEVSITDGPTNLHAVLVVATPVLGTAHAIERCDPACG